MRSKKDLIFHNPYELEKKREKIYTVKDKYSISLTAKKDGKAHEYGKIGAKDLVYVVDVGMQGKVPVLYFKALKFAGKPNQDTIFSGNAAYFEKYAPKEETSGADGEKEVEDKKYGVVIISALAVGTLGFFLAKSYGKNKILFSLGGMAIGGALGAVAKIKPKLEDYALKASEIVGKNKSLTTQQKDKIRNELNVLDDRTKEVAYDYINKKTMLDNDLVYETKQKVADEKMKQLEQTFEKRYGKDEMERIKKILNQN